ncbi:hypothetical protein [Pseudoalteromonas obscura]|uniref:Alginate lyase n=1 Tax=Pseudoalteromonas obscura TaxID=3048491 RepID=A0ABT7EUD1_9GAMM|nr:hypothetical protein [Pseudoalteromonas sp. P94(2023)]MDK2598667.1 hypothetical protein [Pseudoalteromonas sp. P94(2023)]
MTNLFTGNAIPSGYISYSGNDAIFHELANVETTRPISVEQAKMYRVTPDGGTASRFRIRETLTDGTSRANKEFADGNWTEHLYLAGNGVVSIEIYYKNTSDTATGIVFVETAAKTVDAKGFVNSMTVANLVPAFASKLEIDAGSNSERVMVFDRLNGELLDNVLISGNSIAETVGGHTIQITLPAKYALGPSITCVLIDDNLEFSGAIMDGVQCELIDLTL